MKRIRMESIKSLLLIVLVALSLIQVGILWYYQYHRLPISFLSTLYTVFNQKSPPDLSNLKEEAILPTSITVSDEYAASRWVLNSENEHFRKLGIEAYSYIQTVLSDDFNQKPEKLPVNDWNSISKPFMFEMGSSMDIDVIKFLSNLKKTSSPNAPPGIFKMVIDPWSDQNERNTLYFLYGDVIYKYTVPFIKNGFDADSYEKLLTSLAKDKNALNINFYKDIDPDNGLGYPIKPDVPIVVKKPYKTAIPGISAYVPDNLVLRYNDNGDPNPSNIAKTLLGDDLKNFDQPETDGKGTVTLKNANNIYKQHRNGLMEYTYWSQSPADDKGDLKLALEKAFQFISEKQELMSKTLDYRLILKEDSLTRDKKAYEFKFDYIFNGVPVVIVGTGTDGSKQIENAVTIQANSNGVVGCRWLVRNFKVQEVQKAHYYNLSFEKFLVSYKSAYNELKGNKGISITEMRRVYLGSEDAEEHLLPPAWSLKMQDQTGAASYRFFNIPLWKED
jgi:regulatory protein YycH of two-component signal transduction system YycFG